jgi:hypothetical protein
MLIEGRAAMKKIIIATIVAVSALTGVAQAATGAVSDFDFLQAARCRGLAASEGLGKLDTAGIDAFLKVQSNNRESNVLNSARSKISGAQKDGDKASGAKKDKLLAERSGACSTYISAAN